MGGGREGEEEREGVISYLMHKGGGAWGSQSCVTCRSWIHAKRGYTRFRI